MGDIDGETFQWLSSLKLGEKLQYYSDFENGYYMGVIFERHNLAKGRKFKNTKDTACKFQNFKNVRDLLLQNFNVEFPIQNILFNTEALLKTIQECIVKYNRDKKEAAMRKIESFSASKIQPHEEKLFASRQKEILSTSKMNQSKFPKKIQEIQQKLQKYKNIKTQHELMALQDRKKELEDNRRLIDQHRIYELNKVRTNHEFIKQHERKVLDVWMKTEQIKQARIEKDNTLKSFLEDKKNKFYQSLREEEVRSFKEGLEAFNLNCIRQGIELEHDPDKPLRKTEDSFNKQVVMERIKDNIKIHEKERKQRIKRQNKKAVDAKQANIKSEMIWNENNLVEKYAKRIKTQIDKCEHTKKVINRQEAERVGAAHKNSFRTFSELPQSKIDNSQREEQYRKRKIQYLDEQVERLERRQRKHKAIAENALQALIHIVIQSEQQYKTNQGFNFQEWKALEREFLAYEKKDKRGKDLSKFVDSSYENKAKEYINGKGSWETTGEKYSKLELSNAIAQVVSIGYPEKTAPEAKSLPLYMPLKITLVGDSLSGKTTLSQKIAQKYGIVFINPVSTITQAFELNKQPVVQDPKKKKDSKKPQEQNPQKIALKQWGEKLMKRLANPASATLEHYIEAIQFKINYNFNSKAGEQILKEFQQAKVQQAERYAKALKDFEEVQKKGKKDPKKAAQQSQEPPAQRKYFYTKGFVIDGIDLSAETVRQIEGRLTGYLPFEQKINQRGEEIKETISNIIKIPQAQKDPRLVRGTFDLIIELSATDETLQARQTAEKAKAAQKDLHSLEQFYSDFGTEATKVKAYRKISNNGTADECLAEVCKMIEEHLDYKYQEILSSKAGTQEEKTEPQQQALAVSAYSQISRADSEKLLKKLMQIYTKYSKKVSQSFSDFDTLRDDFSRFFLSTQQAFINIINRPDDKAGKILNFQENYNKLQSQKVNIVKDVEASKHLISKLDELYDGLWVSLQSKKNEAVQERQKLLNSTMLNYEIEKVIEISRKLMQNELTLLIEVIFFIYDLNNALQGSSQEISPEYLVLGIPAHLEPIFSFEQKEHISDRLDYYTKQVKQCLADLPTWLAKRQKKFKISKRAQTTLMLSQFIEDRVAKIQSKLFLIRNRVKEYYLEYFCYFKVLVNKMDDWIIQGIKYENEFVYDIYKSIKKSIQDAKKSSIKDLFVRDITDIIRPLTALPANRLPIVASTPSQFKLLSYGVFMQEVKCLSSNGRIPFKLFQSYLEKRRKSQLLEKEFLSVELDIMQQYLVTDDYCNYREVALGLLLWKVKILDEDEINEYQARLTGRKSPPEEYSTVKEELTLQEFTIIPLISSDRQEQRMLKVFIFEIFRQDFRDTISVKELIDTLRLFSQLQVYKYGDTLMMLREGTLSRQQQGTLNRPSEGQS